MRITGLATGLDIDSIVKSSLLGYQTKINTQQQNKEVLEIKQTLYRDLMSKATTFYNKYFSKSGADSLLLNKDYNSVKFDSSNSSVVTATGSSNANVENYSVEVTKLASTASTTLKDLKAGQTITIDMPTSTGTLSIDVEVKGSTQAEMAANLKSDLSSYGLTAKKSDIAGGIVLETSEKGKDASFSIDLNDGSGAKTYTGTNLNAKITSGNNTYVIDDTTNATTSDSVTLDGVTFNFTGTSTTPVSLTGKNDVSEVKDKLVNFINDYNELITELNTQTQTTHNRDYSPLTSDQKSAMSESEIKLWEEKVKEGQLYKDSTLTSITNSLKSTMRTYSSSLNLNLEKIGITPVSDYSGTANGTFTIDEDKLTSALENNMSDVMELLTNDTSVTKKGEDGIFVKLKNTLNDNMVKSNSTLSKKAGLTGTSTFSNNELTKQIAKYESKISDMETVLSTKEQALYSKWATVETLMNKLNSQQSNLSSYFS